MLQVSGEHVHTYQPGEMILQEGQPNDRKIYILVDGVLGIFKEGKEVARIAEAGSFFGEISAILNIDRIATIKALEISEVCAAPYDPNVFFVRFPQLGVKLLQAVVKRLSNVAPQGHDFIQS